MTDKAPPKEKPYQELDEDARKAAAVEHGLKVTWEGKVYQVHFGELSGLDALELRRQTGYTTSELWRTTLMGFIDADTMAIIVWLARRLAGDVVPFVDVATKVKWQAEMLVDLADRTPEAPPPVTDEKTGEAAYPQA